VASTTVISGTAARWNDLATRNQLVGFGDFTLRGAGQVMFQNNPVTGLLFLLGITWGAFAEHLPQVAIGAWLAVIVSSLTAVVLRLDKVSMRSGLYGYNGVLVGCAVPTFLHNDATMWVWVVIGSIASVIVMLAVTNVVEAWGVSALTFPFVLTSWFLLLSAYAFANTPVTGIGPAAFAQQASATAAQANWTISAVLEAIFAGVSQVFLINNAITGIIFVIALVASSSWAGGFALFGSAVALVFTQLVGANGSNVEAGLFAFSAVLTAIALGSVFYEPSWPVLIYTTFGVIFTVIVQAAMDMLLVPLGIPTLTAPFVFATWLFLLPKLDLTRSRRATVTTQAAS